MNWEGIQYFTPDEFECPGMPGSGEYMKREFVEVLDAIRHECAFPFRITSGWRSIEHNARIQGVTNSPHLRGYAADVSAQTSRHRFAIVNAAIRHGISRIGVGSSFVHLDNDPSKVNRLLWLY